MGALGAVVEGWCAGCQECLPHRLPTRCAWHLMHSLPSSLPPSQPAHQGEPQIRLPLQHRIGQAHQAAAKPGCRDPGATQGVKDEEDSKAGG